MYDIIIVGAGPAGLFAAYELIKLCKEQKRLGEEKKPSILLIEKGKSIKKRERKEVMCGVGGAGTFSDGKLHFTPVLSHEKMLDLYTIQEYQKIVDYVDRILTNFGVIADYYPKDLKEVEKLVDEARRNSIELFARKIRHVGSDGLPGVISNFENFLVNEGVELRTETEVKDILVEKGFCQGIVLKEKEQVRGKFVILCPGRVSATWLQEISKRYELGYDYDKVEIGVRVEFPEAIMRRHAEKMYEAIFVIRTPTFDDLIRTFCPCPKGMVAVEDYEDFVCVNGHSNSDHNSENSNFAFLSEVKLTQPVENTTAYAESIAHMATTIGGGKPILQRLGDLKCGQRSTWARLEKSYIKPTLREVTPGDISMALPHRIVTNIVEGLDMLDKVMPGISSSHTLLYAPELKFRGSKIRTTKGLETSVKNLFVAGDGAGLSGNIVGAAATGIIAARGVLEKGMI